MTAVLACCWALCHVHSGRMLPARGVVRRSTAVTAALEPPRNDLGPLSDLPSEPEAALEQPSSELGLLPGDVPGGPTAVTAAAALEPSRRSELRSLLSEDLPSEPTADTAALGRPSSEPIRLTDDTPSDLAGNRQFGWGAMGSFEGARVNELKRKERVAETRPPTQRAASVLRNLRELPLGTLLLILLFVPLTFVDVFFNVSRGFICALPDLCDAAPQ